MNQKTNWNFLWPMTCNIEMDRSSLLFRYCYKCYPIWILIIKLASAHFFLCSWESQDWLASTTKSQVSNFGIENIAWVVLSLLSSTLKINTITTSLLLLLLLFYGRVVTTKHNSKGIELSFLTFSSLNCFWLPKGGAR